MSLCQITYGHPYVKTWCLLWTNCDEHKYHNMVHCVWWLWLVLAPCLCSSVPLPNLGVFFESFNKQMSNLVILCLLAKTKPFLTCHNLNVVASCVLISSWLADCNTLYVGITQSSLNCPHLVQNAAGRLLTITSRWAHITLLIFSLHWLRVHFRINFKLFIF